MEVNDGAFMSNDGGIVDRESLDIDRVVIDCAQSFSCSSLTRLPYSSSDSSTRPSSRSNGEPMTDAGNSESSCFHSWINSSIDIRLSMAEPFLRRDGILGMAVTAKRAATAGGMASDLWVLEECCGLPPLVPRTFTVWVWVVFREGIRGGITTGWECMSGVDVTCWGAGSGLISMFLTRIDLERVGGDRGDRTPIFSLLRCGWDDVDWRIE